MIGYSGKTLAKKLGFKSGMRAAFYHAPRDYQTMLGKLPQNVRLVGQGKDLDFVQYFCRHRQALASALPGLRARIKPGGMIWVSWPKRTSGVTTDVNENIVRHLAIQQGLVDVKVAAVDDVWSALLLVIPRRLRP